MDAAEGPLSASSPMMDHLMMEHLMACGGPCSFVMLVFET